MRNIEETKHMDTPAWGVTEVCAFTGLDRRMVYRMADEGTFREARLTGAQRRRRRFVPREIVAKWAEICGVEARA